MAITFQDPTSGETLIFDDQQSYDAYRALTGQPPVPPSPPLSSPPQGLGGPMPGGGLTGTGQSPGLPAEVGQAIGNIAPVVGGMLDPRDPRNTLPLLAAVASGPLGLGLRGATALQGVAGFGGSLLENLRQNQELDVPTAMGTGTLTAGGNVLGHALTPFASRPAPLIPERATDALSREGRNSTTTILGFINSKPELVEAARISQTGRTTLPWSKPIRKVGEMLGRKPQVTLSDVYMPDQVSPNRFAKTLAIARQAPKFTGQLQPKTDAQRQFVAETLPMLYARELSDIGAENIPPEVIAKRAAQVLDWNANIVQQQVADRFSPLTPEFTATQPAFKLIGVNKATGRPRYGVVRIPKIQADVSPIADEVLKIRNQLGITAGTNSPHPASELLDRLDKLSKTTSVVDSQGNPQTVAVADLNALKELRTDMFNYSARLKREPDQRVSGLTKRFNTLIDRSMDDALTRYDQANGTALADDWRAANAAHKHYIKTFKTGYVAAVLKRADKDNTDTILQQMWATPSRLDQVNRALAVMPEAEREAFKNMIRRRYIESEFIDRFQVKLPGSPEVGGTYMNPTRAGENLSNISGAPTITDKVLGPAQAQLFKQLVEAAKIGVEKDPQGMLRMAMALGQTSGVTSAGTGAVAGTLQPSQWVKASVWTGLPRLAAAILTGTVSRTAAMSMLKNPTKWRTAGRVTAAELINGMRAYGELENADSAVIQSSSQVP